MSDKTTDLLQKLQSGQITLKECQQTLNTVKKVESQVHYKVSPKGCISFYGIRRMPISLYLPELKQILAATMESSAYNPEFAAWVDENKEKLSKH